ncbi:MAG: asparagine synthase (glutamine-hydrolyzing) [Campylobacterales bacterium]
MCGIFGVTGEFERSKTKDVIASMGHRGPDGNGIKDFGGCLLAHVRLAIIDPLPEADQPFLSDDGLAAIVFNGEIYNYKELISAYGLTVKTSSDTEVVLRLYEKFGVECARLLDGMFAFAIWDDKQKRLFAARDIAGEKPFYYAKLADSFVFGSTTESILASGCMGNVRISRQAIWDFFSFLWVPQPNTIFEGIYALMPGHTLLIDGDEMRITPYSNKFDDDYKKNINEFVRQKVEKTIADRLMSDVPIGAFLSGGVDSSIVCAVAAESKKDFPTFSVGFEDDHDVYSGYADETKYAIQVSERLQTKHTAIRVGAKDFEELLDDFVLYADQPFAVVSGLGVLAVAKEAKNQGVKVLLSGDGADEIFGGYGWHIKVRYSDQNAFSADKPKGWHYYVTETQKRSFLSKIFFDSCDSSTRLLVKDPLKAQPKEFLKHDMEFYLKNEMMTKLDRMTMAYGVEGRAAFVSPKLLGFADSVSYDELLPTEETKYLLKNAFSDMLPVDILSRPKHGFNPPIDYWMKNEWRGLLEDALSEQSYLYRLGIIDDGSVAAFWDFFESERGGGTLGFCFVVLNKWLASIQIKHGSVLLTDIGL